MAAALEAGSDFTDRPWEDPSAKPFIEFQGVAKSFDDVQAVKGVDLAVYKGELFSLLGGSGCGKTTLLRMLAGFEEPTEGRILVDGEDMAGIPPYRRPCNMMFQSYALFPHLTVEQNIAFGLKQDGVPKAEIADRVGQVLSLVELEAQRKRKPHQLSGGQRQRVALARAIVKRPKVLLLDEPLGALDKRLREQAQFELMKLQDETGVTMVVVTHDQEEAMVLSTRIAVMHEGLIQQIGTPSDIYEFPANRFVADFLGNITLIEGTVTAVDGDVVTLETPEWGRPVQVSDNRAGHRPGDRAFVAVRPEKITISQKGVTPNSIEVGPVEVGPVEADASANRAAGVVEDLAYLGDVTLYRVRLESGLIVEVTRTNTIRGARRSVDWDSAVEVAFRPDNALLVAG
ncbi:MAG: ABC transporter ATP-binding protein [Alphaproteobacteria bacterium]|nr:ABC transporter ATP-binding protein [Alphaproteobacteria bacterium]